MELIRSIGVFAREEDGTSVIEYALVASLIALAAVTIMGTLGGTLSNMFNFINGQLKTS